MNADDADGEETLLAVGTIRGFREWLIRYPLIGYPGAIELRSITSPMVWDRAEPVPATCQRRDMGYGIALFAGIHADQPAPVRTCSCGYYALHQPAPHHYAPTSTSVRGVVEGFGRVIIGPLGFRSEKIRIVALSANIRGAAHINVEEIFHNYLPGNYLGAETLYRFSVTWPSGATTRHQYRLSDRELTQMVVPITLGGSFLDAHLLDVARKQFPQLAELESEIANGNIKRALEAQFKVPVYTTPYELFAAFPPVASDLIPARR